MDATDASRVRAVIDKVFNGRTLVDKEEVEREAQTADLPEEVMEYLHELPPGHYGPEELRQRLIGPVSSEIPMDIRGRSGRGS